MLSKPKLTHPSAIFRRCQTHRCRARADAAAGGAGL